MEKNPTASKSTTAWALWILLAVGLLALLVSLVFRFGGLAWLSSRRHVPLRSHPFGVDAGVVVDRGAAFGDAVAVRNLAKGIRERFLAAEAAQEAGNDSADSGAWQSLLRETDFPVLRARAILASLNWKPLSDSLAVSPQIVSALDSALKKYPDQSLLLYLQGRVFEAMVQSASADSSYARAARVSPQFAFPHLRLARRFGAQGKWGRAEAEYRLALSLWISDSAGYAGREGTVPRMEPPPYAGLAGVFYHLGYLDSAALVLESARLDNAVDPDLDFLQALINEENGSLATADSVYLALKARYPERARYAGAHATLGLKPARGITQAANRASAVFAISLLEPLSQRFPKNAPLRLALGQAYLHRGLYALAAASLDTAFRIDSSLSEARPLRDAAYHLWRKEPIVVPAVDSAAVVRTRRPVLDDSLSDDGVVKVIVPGSTGLLGSYSVPWGATPGDVRRAYPGKIFATLPNGNLRETFVEGSTVHNYLLTFRKGELWGMLIVVTDTSKAGSDLFGQLLQLKTKISGEGRGTGETTCPGGKDFQGVIWENDDTFEFMAQFQHRQNQVRLARLSTAAISESRRVCDLAQYLEPAAWK